MLTRDDIKHLVAAYTPIMYMHPADKFMPCSAEWFMERSCLEAAGPVVNGEVRVLSCCIEASCSGLSKQQVFTSCVRHGGMARKLRDCVSKGQVLAARWNAGICSHATGHSGVHMLQLLALEPHPLSWVYESLWVHEAMRQAIANVWMILTACRGHQEDCAVESEPLA